MSTSKKEKSTRRELPGKINSEKLNELQDLFKMAKKLEQKRKLLKHLACH